MPCGACVISFDRKPCEHLLKTVEDIETLKHHIITRVPYDGIECMIVCYKALHYNCPCKECIVKVTCNVQFDKRCDDYKELINKIHSLYYDEINGRYRPSTK